MIEYMHFIRSIWMFYEVTLKNPEYTISSSEAVYHIHIAFELTFIQYTFKVTNNENNLDRQCRGILLNFTTAFSNTSIATPVD